MFMQNNLVSLIKSLVLCSTLLRKIDVKVQLSISARVLLLFVDPVGVSVSQVAVVVLVQEAVAGQKVKPGASKTETLDPTEDARIDGIVHRHCHDRWQGQESALGAGCHFVGRHWGPWEIMDTLFY